MQLYSRVLQFASHNEEATQEIEKLKAGLPGLITGLINQVRAFSLAGRPLTDSVPEADQLSERLRAFLALCRYTNDSAGHKARLETAQTLMTGKQQSAHRLADLLAAAAAALTRAAQDGRFDAAEQAMREAKGLEAALPEVKELDEKIRTTAAARRKLQGELLPSLKAAWQEDDDPASWERILGLCREIRDVESRYNFGLAGEIGEYYDERLDKKIKDYDGGRPPLEALEQLTRERMVNYKAWLEWLTPGQALHKEAVGTLKAARDQTGKQPLAQLARSYDAGLGKCGEALRYFAAFWPAQPKSQLVRQLQGDDDPPQPTPLAAPNSWLAQDLAEQASKLAADLDGKARDAERGRADVASDHQQFQAKLAEAETYINRAEIKPTRKGIADAEKRLAEARAIDGLAEELARLDQRVLDAKRRLR